MKMKFILLLSILFFSDHVFSAVYWVTSNSSGGSGTLRTAITSANANPGKDTIYFNLGASVSSRTINLSLSLASLNDAVLIDATTTSGAFFGNSHAKVIIKPATSSTNIMNGLTINADHCEIYGLFIKGFQTGIEFPSNALRSHCKIGAPGKGNVISGNSTTGMEMWNVQFTQVSDNFIGVDTSGTAALANAAGIDSWTKLHDVIIGGPDETYRNVISGNNGTGMLLGNVDSVYVQHNFIGLNWNGTAAIPNTGVGLQLGLIETLQIPSVIEFNVISGNTQKGLHADAPGLIVRGNYIGTNANGDAAIPNVTGGLVVFKNNVTVDENVISGNNGDGIQVSFTASQCVITRNKIGLGANGLTALGNNGNGIEVLGNDAIVGHNIGDGNTVVNNTENGISANGDHVSIKGNFIGVLPINNQTTGNGLSGILLSASAASVVGGLEVGEGNKIANNTGAGISESQSNELSILGNFIYGNGSNGIVILSANTGMSILGNHIGEVGSGNGGAGIRFNSPSAGVTLGNEYYPNWIAGNGMEGIYLANGMNGVVLYNNRYSCNSQVVAGEGAVHLGTSNQGITPGSSILNEGVLSGTTAPNRRIDVFYNGSDCGTCEGWVFYEPLMSDAAGNWSVVVNPQLGHWMVMETDANGNSSRFSACQEMSYCADLILEDSVQSCFGSTVNIESNDSGHWVYNGSSGTLSHLVLEPTTLYYWTNTELGSCVDSVVVEVFEGDVYYGDQDMDGFGDSGNTTVSCNQPPGFVLINGDCNDTDGNVYPGAVEVCNDMDDDCDNQMDEDLELFFQFSDQDADGYGAMMSGFLYCELLPGYVLESGDCDDQNPLLSPSVSETCNAVDDNCNGEVDEGLPTTMQYLDEDADGYGDDDMKIENCLMIAGYVLVGGDCADNNFFVNPGVEEIMDNAIDENCDGEVGVGIDEHQLPMSAAISGDQLCLKGMRDARVKVYDGMGRLVMSTKVITDTEWISISGWASGVYSVQMKGRVLKVAVVR
jgi:hypothetical protein